MLARGHRHFARLLASNPFTAACRPPSSAAAAQQQHPAEPSSYSSCTAGDIPGSRDGAAGSQAAGLPASAWPPVHQQPSARSFASGTTAAGGPPREPSDGLPPGGETSQPPDWPAGAAAPAGDADWAQPDSQALAPHSQPDDQELNMDQLMERWEAMMDAKADPLEILDTVWSAVESEPGLPDWEEILERGDEEEAVERAQRRSRERKLQEEFAEKRVRVVDDLGRSYATGKRKTSIARAWLREGSGNLTVNGRPMTAYFSPLQRRADVLAPFVATSTLGMFDLYSTVRGGGQTGQAQALRHGIARALQLFNPEHRPVLKAAGLLTRDSRIVERKKPGKAKARKSFQWVKR